MLQHWLNQVRQNGKAGVGVAIVGRNCALDASRVVGVEEGKNLAKELGVDVCEVGAKSAAHDAQTLLASMVR